MSTALVNAVSQLITIVATMAAQSPSGGGQFAQQLQSARDACDAALAEISPPSVVHVPAVTPIGSATVGDTLTCTTGNWRGTPDTYAYAWMAGEKAVGTNSASYTPVAADAGSEITCTVTATNAYGSTAAPPSNAVSIAPAVTTARAKS